MEQLIWAVFSMAIVCFKAGLLTYMSTRKKPPLYALGNHTNSMKRDYDF